jgi:hypothetical protein
MFWRSPHTSTGAVRRALDLVRASLLLDPTPYDWAVELDWPDEPVVSRALVPLPLTNAAHRPPLRLVHSRSRAGAVPERPQHCLSPVGQASPQVCSRSHGRGLDPPLRGAGKHAADR